MIGNRAEVYRVFSAAMDVEGPGATRWSTSSARGIRQ